jgi:hypothetical protein
MWRDWAVGVLETGASIPLSWLHGRSTPLCPLPLLLSNLCMQNEVIWCAP